MGKRPSLLHRLTASPTHLDATELRSEVSDRACVAVAECACGSRVKLVGRLRSVVYTPSETVPTLRAELFDGTDSIELVWLGRRRIPGIEPGRRLVVRGRVGQHEGRRAIFNPWYELLAPGA